MATKTQPLTAKQLVVLDAITAKGARTDAEIGEMMPTTKLSAIASVTRSLIKRGLIVRSEAGHYVPPVVDEVADEGEEVVEEVTTAPVDLTDTPDEDAAEEPAPGTQVFTDDQNAGWAKALEIQSSGRTTPVEFSKSGWAKSFTIGKTAYLTRNGQYLAAKGTLDGQPKAPWAVYAITEEGMTLMGTFPTCTKALSPEGLA